MPMVVLSMKEKELTMKKIYKESDLIVWEDEKDHNNSCHFGSVSDYEWYAVDGMDGKYNEIGNFTSKDKAFKALQAHMKKIGYTIKL